MIKPIKKIILASFMIYAFNMVAINFNIVLPINVWTVLFTAIFDISGLFIILIIKTMGV